jgi:hypothetical protein
MRRNRGRVLGASPCSGISPPTSVGDTDILLAPLEILEGVGGVKKYKRVGRVTVKATIMLSPVMGGL